METSRRPRLKDIAAKVGVSTMLVSIALRGMPGVSERTRQKIQKCAKKLGYQPDPALSALADYRRRIRPTSSFAQLAYVTSYPHKDALTPAWAFSNEFFIGAQKRGLEFGYEVIHYPLNEGGCTLRKASSILFNRGIKGLLIAPLPVENGHLDLTWKYFSAVALGTSLIRPRLDYAAFDHHDGMQVVLEKLRLKGYHRIGLSLLRHRNARQRSAPLDAYLGDQYRHSPKTPLPPLVLEKFSAPEFWSWFNAYTPDAIITDIDSEILGIIEKRGLSVPKDLGVACVGRFFTSNTAISAVTQNLQAIGSAAVDRLHTNLLRNAYGIPKYSHGTLVHGHWEEGSTLRKHRPARHQPS